MTDVATETTQESAPTGLSIQDLTLTLQVISIAASRGSFKAEELSAVGGLYDRIFKFLESTGAITKAADTTDAATDAAEEK